ncbi:MAG TPA: uroporphyrinogen-III synthase [Alphaproteobacteria bacterium]|nr:uroporphyrinogen-III synthase [Alphaproteobacteria bacterium]
MAQTILITRPREDAEKLAADLEAQGFDTLIEPMLHIDFLKDPGFSAAGAQAILLTSANGARALGRTGAPRDIRVLAVGTTTAAAARAAGFRNVETAGGNVSELARLAGEILDPKSGPAIHVSGRDVAGDLAGALSAQGFTYRRHVLYKARAAEALGEAARAALASGAIAGVVFYSARTAATFVMLVKQAGLAATLRALTAYCLSEAVATAARDAAWARVEISAGPADRGQKSAD